MLALHDFHSLCYNQQYRECLKNLQNFHGTGQLKDFFYKIFLEQTDLTDALTVLQYISWSQTIFHDSANHRKSSVPMYAGSYFLDLSPPSTAIDFNPDLL